MKTRSRRTLMHHKLRERFILRIRAVSMFALRCLVGNKATLQDMTRYTRQEAVDALHARRDLDRAQWRRWYKVNQKQQRQLTALKRLGGGKISPNLTGIPRVFVP